MNKPASKKSNPQRLRLKRKVRRLEEKLEAAKELLREYEAWEAQVVLGADREKTGDGLPALNQELVDELIRLQEKRNEILERR